MAASATRCSIIKIIRSKTKINSLTEGQELSTIMRERNQRSPRPSCDDQLLIIEKGVSHGSDAVSETNQPKQFIHTITSTFTIQDQHVSDPSRQECDGEVIGCLNMLTRTYTTGRRQHYSRRTKTSKHEHIHYKALEIEHSTQHTRSNVAKKVRQRSIWIIKVLKPTKLMCQMCLQSHTQTHLNQTTKSPKPTKSRFHISVRAV
jgi:hypothetical protein